MSWSERRVQDHRLRTDRAIHNACVQLARDPIAFKKFQEMLCCARQRAPRLFEAPVTDGRHVGVDALVHLSRFRDAHLRPVMNWAGTSSSWRPAVASLAHHLICTYHVHMFLSSCWYEIGYAADRKRGWFIAHSNGASFRSLNLPIVMTRKMEHIFLVSPDHLSIEYAMRKAELLALGASHELVKVVMSTQLATDLCHSDFWRTVWAFLISNANDIDLEQVGPMIDYLQAIRHHRTTMQTRNGPVNIDPPYPEFSMKGRTVQSMLRLMRDWHEVLGGGNAALSWGYSIFKPLLIEEPTRDDSKTPRRWQITELTNCAELRREGSALRHCVSSYANRCYSGTSSIWSLRLWQGEKIHHVVTIEVDPKKRAIVQARGLANRTPSGKSLRLIRDWAARENLQIAV